MPFTDQHELRIGRMARRLASVKAALEQMGGRWDLLVRLCKGVPTSGRQSQGTYMLHRDIPGAI